MSNQKINTGDIHGDAIGTGSSGIVAREINGPVLQIVVNSPDEARQILNLKNMPTEVNQDQAAGLNGNGKIADSKSLQDSINQLLNAFKEAEKKGHHIDEVHIGKSTISEVELLLKKAILVKAEADQMYFDQINKNKNRTDNHSDVDINTLLYGFNEDVHTNKLQEAYNLLVQANKIEPANTEVLLHMAQVLIELTPDDPTDEQELLYRIQKLLNNPKNDAEWFRLGQATYLLATSGKAYNSELLTGARNIFERLGRAEWVKQCDIIINQQSERTNQHIQPFHFNPSGYWIAYVSDIYNSTLELWLYPNGHFEGKQHYPGYGTFIPATGQWLYLPAQKLLQLQGWANGITPFMIGIYFHYQHENTYYGVGTDGYSYNLHRG